MTSPEETPVHIATVPLPAFRLALMRAALFAATDVARPVLNGVQIQSQPGRDRLMLVGSNGIALLMAEARAPGSAGCQVTESILSGMIVPLAAVESILKAIPRATKANADKVVALYTDSGRRYLRVQVELIQETHALALETYPSFAQLFPPDQPDDATAYAAIDPALLALLAKAAGRTTEDRVQFYLNGPSSPVTCVGEGFIALMMPVFVDRDPLSEHVQRFLAT